MASSLSGRAYLDGCFYLFCEDREINLEVIEERFSDVIHLIITDSPCLECHVVTLQSAVCSVIEAWARYSKNKL